MAVSSDNSDALRKLEEQITCSVCLEHYISPKTLPCLHPFCHQCLDRLPLDCQGQKQFLSCPTCRIPTELPKEGVAGFPVAFLINNLTEVYTLLKKGSGDQHVSCDNCKKSDATGYCKQCSKFYCTKCLSVHNDQLTFVDHIVIGIDKVTNTFLQPPDEPDVTLVKSKIMNIYKSTKVVINSEDSSYKPENEGISTGILCRAIANYSYEAQDDIELSLEEGQIVEIINEYENGWWLVRVNGMEGVIPSNFVMKLDNEGEEVMKVPAQQTGLESVPFTKTTSQSPLSADVSEEHINEKWFFGKMKRSTAEKKLLQSSNQPGTFLIREDEIHSDKYLLSVRSIRVVRHYCIHKVDSSGVYYIHPRTKFFSLNDLVTHYQSISDGLCSRLTVCCPKDIDNKWEIEKCSIHFVRQLHEGKFSDVWEGLWNNMTPVAVKIFKEGTMPVQDFLAKAELMKKLHHPKVLELYSVSTKKEPIYIITELMTKGNLLYYLRGEGRHLKLPTLIDFGAQVADGMEYLGRQHYIHRNLAARNVLVGDNNIIKIAGLTSFENNDDYSPNEITSYWHEKKWTAPEALHFNHFTIKSDVWSFGILLYELVTHGHNPYIGLTNVEVLNKIENGYRMPMPKDCPEPLYKIMLDCWKAEPQERLTFEYLHYTLEDFFNAVED